MSKRALTETLKLCYEDQESVGFSVSQDGTTILAEVDGCQIYILLAAVKYPNYRSVLPKKPKGMPRYHEQSSSLWPEECFWPRIRPGLCNLAS